MVRLRQYVAEGEGFGVALWFPGDFKPGWYTVCTDADQAAWLVVRLVEVLTAIGKLDVRVEVGAAVAARINRMDGAVGGMSWN